MDKDRIWILFGRRVSGEITPKEMEELKALIMERPDQGYSMEIVLMYLESGRKFDDRADAGFGLELVSRLEAAMTNPVKALRSE
jgi:hypothetical protein